MLGNNGSSGPVHDKTQTLAFLQLLDPSAERFTWQFLYDDKSRKGRPLPSGLNSCNTRHHRKGVATGRKVQHSGVWHWGFHNHQPD